MGISDNFTRSVGNFKAKHEAIYELQQIKNADYLSLEELQEASGSLVKLDQELKQSSDYSWIAQDQDYLDACVEAQESIKEQKELLAKYEEIKGKNEAGLTEEEKDIKAKWDTKKGEISATGQVDANGHLAEGELSGNIGYLNGSVKAGIGVAAATGSVGATLFKNGKLSPKLQAKAEGSVSAASGEAKVSVGTDENNIHAKASGDLGKAKAEASVGVGMVSTKNADGEEKTAFGAEGKFEVGAYAAEGKISGGLTIFGIKVDASIKGKAGGVGAEVGGSVTTNGVSGTIGAAFGLGGGVEISVDWSEFSLFGKKKK